MSHLPDYTLLHKYKTRGTGYEFVHYEVGNKRRQRQKDWRKPIFDTANQKLQKLLRDIWMSGLAHKLNGLVHNPA